MVPLNIRRIVRNGIRNPKVDEFQLALDEDEVGRLKIRVHDLLVVNNLDGLKHLGVVRTYAIGSAKTKHE